MYYNIMSLLIDQLNRDNDVLYMIGDVVTKFKQETEKNKQVYNSIVDDLNYVFNERIVSDPHHVHIHGTVEGIYYIFNTIDTLRRSRNQARYGRNRLHKLFSGYKYNSCKHDRVRHPVGYHISRRDYMGCSYPKIHLADKLPKAIKNWTQFYHVRRWSYEDLQNQVCRHKAGIQGWYECQYKLY